MRNHYLCFQDAEAVLKHGADVKELVEEPLKVSSIIEV
jgi:hypothetical protein